MERHARNDMKRIRERREEIKRQKIEEPEDSTTELLVKIGEIMDAAEFRSSKKLEGRCISCGAVWNERCDIGKVPRELTAKCDYDGDCVCKTPKPHITITSKFECAAIAFICVVCEWYDNPRYDACNLEELHTGAKAVLQTLPLPIFEEVWNHVGYEQYIKT